MKSINKIILLGLVLAFGCDSTPEVGPHAPEFVTFQGSSTVTIFENGGTKEFSVITSAIGGANATITAASDDAVEGVDFTISTSTIEIGENEYEATFSITIIDNFAADGNKTVVLSLDSDDVALGGASDITVTIVDNDCAYDLADITGVLAGTDGRNFTDQLYTSAATFTYVSASLLQVVDMNTGWMEGYWGEEVTTAHTVDIAVSDALALTIASQPISETLYEGSPFSYTVSGSGSIDTCGEMLTISYMVYDDDGLPVRSSNFKLALTLP